MKRNKGFTPLEKNISKIKRGGVFCEINSVRSRRSLTGFTLMELMIVMAIIIILTGAIIMKVGKGTDRAAVAKAKAEMEAIASACRAFFSDTNAWPRYNNWQRFNIQPNTADAGLIDQGHFYYTVNVNGSYVWMGAGNADGDKIRSKWKGPYLDAVEFPTDPWGTWRYNIYYDPNSKVLAVLSPGPNMNWDSGYNLSSGEPAVGTDDLVTVIHRF